MASGAPSRLGPNLFRTKPVFVNPSTLAVKRVPKIQARGQQTVKTNAYGLLTFQAHTIKSSDLSVQQNELTQSIDSERDDFLLENLPDRDHRPNMFRNISVISKDGTSDHELATSPLFPSFNKKKVTGFSSLQKIQVKKKLIPSQIISQQQHAQISGSISSEGREHAAKTSQHQKPRQNTPPKSILSKSNKSSLRTLNSKQPSTPASQPSQKKVRFSMMRTSTKNQKERVF
jgi:hypothetical protein